MDLPATAIFSWSEGFEGFDGFVATVFFSRRFAVVFLTVFAGLAFAIDL